MRPLPALRLIHQIASPMNLREMASPSPVPSTFFAAVPTWRNSSNTASCVLNDDTHPGVRYRYLRRTISQFGPNTDLSAIGRELQRVRQKVEKHLLHLALVGANHSEVLVDRASKFDAAPHRALPHESQRVLDGVGQIEKERLQWETRTSGESRVRWWITPRVAPPSLLSDQPAARRPRTTGTIHHGTCIAGAAPAGLILWFTQEAPWAPTSDDHSGSVPGCREPESASPIARRLRRYGRGAIRPVEWSLRSF
jgi:hypothetical protein